MDLFAIKQTVESFSNKEDKKVARDGIYDDTRNLLTGLYSTPVIIEETDFTF